MSGFLVYELQNNPILQKLTTNTYKSLLKALLHSNRSIEKRRANASLGLMGQLEESVNTITKKIGSLSSSTKPADVESFSDDVEGNTQTFDLVLLLPHSHSYLFPNPLSLNALNSYIAHYCPMTGKLLSLNGIKMRRIENKLHILDIETPKNIDNLSREKQLELQKDCSILFQNEELWNESNAQRTIIILRETWVSWNEENKEFEIVPEVKNNSDNVQEENIVPVDKFKLFLISNPILESESEQTNDNGKVQQSTAPQFTFKDFVEKMRHKSTSALVKKLKNFIRDVNENPYSETLPRKVRRFIDAIIKEIERHPLWKDASEAEMENVREGVEKYIMTKIYYKCISTAEDVRIDQELSTRIACFQPLKPSVLDVDPRIITHEQWEAAKNELREMNGVRTPRDKMVCISNCCRLLFGILQGVNPDEDAGADVFLPVLLYLVLQANPPHLHSNIKFINDYRNPDKMVSEAGYFLTNVHSAETFWLHCEPEQLNISEEEFNRLLGNEKKSKEQDDCKNETDSKSSDVPEDHIDTEQDTSNYVDSGNSKETSEDSRKSISSGKDGCDKRDVSINSPTKLSEVSIGEPTEYRVAENHCETPDQEKEYFFVPFRDLNQTDPGNLYSTFNELREMIEEYFESERTDYSDRQYSTMTISELQNVFQKYREMREALCDIQAKLANM